MGSADRSTVVPIDVMIIHPTGDWNPGVSGRTASYLLALSPVQIASRFSRSLGASVRS